MTEPTNKEMREWLKQASPKTKIKHQWVGILLNRLAEVEGVVDNIRHAGSEEKHTFYVMDLLELFDIESGDMKAGKS